LTGTSCYTKAGNLPCDYIIHTVGPIFNNYKECEADVLLKLAVINTLNLASSMEDVKTLSIPAISSGIYGFPKQDCARIMIESVFKWALTGKTGKLREVRLCNFDDPTVKVFKDHFLTVFEDIAEESV